LEPRKLELFDPVAQKQYWFQPATIFTNKSHARKVKSKARKQKADTVKTIQRTKERKGKEIRPLLPVHAGPNHEATKYKSKLDKIKASKKQY
jgi:hypothetical protein